MASPIASVPSTPIARRSFSVPATKSVSKPDPQIEVLYSLPSARIISFSTAHPGSRPSSTNGRLAIEEEPGTLSWASRFERTIAVGPLRIYRAPGSVAFLNCSNALRPILPKSQCWEVDVSGKFVLQIRRPQYWRIEVPNKTDIEQLQAEELKDVLRKVLLFEKTPCPFQRSFSVELPDAPKTPAKKRPWKAVETPTPDIIPFVEPEEDASNSMAITPGNGSRAVLEQVHIPTPITAVPVEHVSVDIDVGVLPVASISENVSAVEITCPLKKSNEVVQKSMFTNGFPPSTQEASSAQFPSGTLVSESMLKNYHGLQGDENYSDATKITPMDLWQPAFQPINLEPEEDKETRPQALKSCSRSVTAPPVLSLVTSPPSKPRRKSPLMCSAVAESDSDFSSSVESFHSVQSWHSPLAPPSPPVSGSSSPTLAYPYPHENIVLPKRPSHTRDTSELTVTPETPRIWEMSPVPDMDIKSGSLSPPPRTPTLVNDGGENSCGDQFEIVTPPASRSNVRHRATTSSNSRCRTLSPLPAAVNLFPPPRRRTRRLRTARHLPTAIIQKTCEILLSPPSHLFQLMLNVASKIAAGEWRGVLSGHGESVHWDFEDEYGGETWTEDDYGISLATTPSKAPKRNDNLPGGSWEVD